MPSIALLHIALLLVDKILDELPDLDEEFEEPFELLPPDDEVQLIILTVCSGLNGTVEVLPIILLLLQLLDTFC